MGSSMDLYNTDHLGVIGTRGCEDFVAKVDRHLQNFQLKKNADKEVSSFIIPTDYHRFGTGEGKATIKHSVRAYDAYIIMDAFNYGVTYNMYGREVPMSPDEHFQDLKRIISAMAGKAKRITVIMPMLYEGRQHKRMNRESLDCAVALRELANMGVGNIITFDAHDPRVQNAIPLNSLENVQVTYQMIKACLAYDPSVILNRKSTMIVSPDEGAMSRCMYYSSVLEIELGMFYKRRDYSRVVNGKNPIVAHEFLGSSVEGKDIIVVDDMIASGDSMIDVSKELKSRCAKRVIIFSTFGLFTEGLEKFDRAHEEGVIDKIFTTNLVYRRDGLTEREWYMEVDLSKYVALIIQKINEEGSISELMNPITRIHKILDKYKGGEV